MTYDLKTQINAARAFLAAGVLSMTEGGVLYWESRRGTLCKRTFVASLRDLLDAAERAPALPDEPPPPDVVRKCRCHLEERRTCRLCIVDRFPLPEAGVLTTEDGFRFSKYVALGESAAPPADDTIRLGDIHYAKDFLA